MAVQQVAKTRKTDKTQRAVATKNFFGYLSLFCGCGGFDLGMPHKHFDCVGAYDINPTAVEVFNKNISNVAIQCDLSVKTQTFPDAEVIIAGPPCQGFSTAGKRELNDPRNSLFLRAVEIALSLKPKVFVAENVAGILAGKHKIHFIDESIRRFEQAGYQTHYFLVNCADLGMAQIRKRTILLAWQTKADLIIPRYIKPKTTLANVIGNIPANLANHDTCCCQALGIHEQIASQIKQGEKLCNVRGSDRAIHTWDIPHVFGETTSEEQELLTTIMRLRRRIRKRSWGDADPVSLDSIKSFINGNPQPQIKSLLKKGYLKRIDKEFDLTHTFNGKYRRLSWDEPSYTVDTRFGSPILFLHPTENRAFTVREAARLQGFPDSFEFLGSPKEQYMMVGNAVPPPLGTFVSKIILSLLDE